MKTYNVTYEYVICEEATVQASTKAEAKRKVEKMLHVQATGAWELKSEVKA